MRLMKINFFTFNLSIILTISLSHCLDQVHRNHEQVLKTINPNSVFNIPAIPRNILGNSNLDNMVAFKTPIVKSSSGGIAVSSS